MYRNGSGPVETFAQRKADTLSARVLRTGQQRAGDLAASLSRKGEYMAGAELANESVGVLIGLCFEVDANNSPVNVDYRTGALLVVVPWGASYRRYGLRARESEILRAHMFSLLSVRRPVPLFTYEPDSRRWSLNFFDYPALGDALGYWQLAGLTPERYRAIAEQLRTRR